MYFCETFTPRFVDPLICKPDELVMKAPHSKETDLYAFDLIFWSTTLYVGPWEGALPLKTKDPKVAGIRPNERALRRVSVFHPDVKYPTWATHFRCLPDDILHHYDLLLHKDVRGKSMRKLLENLRWTNCSSCGFYHARTSCPNCAAPSAPEITVASITKDLVIEKVVDLGSTKILSACFQGGKLRYLYQKGDEFKREFGSIGLTKSLDRDFEYAICGNKTIVSMNGTAVCFSPNENPRRLQAERFRGKSPQYAGNETDIFYLRGGHLIKESNSIEGDFVDETLSNQTLLWVGDTFGIAFYFVGGLQKVKVFKTEEKGSVSVQNMPDLQGTLRHASVYFSKSKAWLFVTTEDKGVLTNNCFIIRKNGECSSSLSVEQGSPDHTWLSGFIHLGKCAAQLKSGSGQRIECLLAATDEGVVGIMEQNGKLIEAMKFEGTKGVVLPTDRLLYDEVLYRIRGGQVHTIRSK